jgi:hypothetical protein
MTWIVFIGVWLVAGLVALFVQSWKKTATPQFHDEAAPTAPVRAGTVPYRGRRAPKIVGAFRLRYVDDSGKDTERVVDAYSITRLQGEARIEGFCHLRNEQRTFRASNMVSLVNEATGEVLTKLKGISIGGEQLIGYGAAARLVRQQETAALDLAIYILSASRGTFRKAHMPILLDYLLSQAAEPKPDRALVERMLRMRYGPDREEFEASLKAARQMSTDKRRAIVGMVTALAPLSRSGPEVIAALNEVQAKLR